MCMCMYCAAESRQEIHGTPKSKPYYEGALTVPVD